MGSKPGKYKRMKMCFAALAAAASIVVAVGPARPAETPPPPPPSPAGTVVPASASPTALQTAAPSSAWTAPPDSITHHTLQLGGKTIAYTAVAGTIALRNAQDEPSASIFYVAYSMDGAPARRPVTFLYNGGPGSSTIWLHLGSFGPRRVAAGNAAPSRGAPYDFTTNQYSLLDRTDLVFIDAPGTGFSRLLGKSDPKDFYGIDQDAAAFGQFIQRYLSQYGRWNSPKFLFGESYGTTRSCVVASYLHDRGIDVNGIVLLSSALNLPVLFGAGDGIDATYFTYLPTETAVAWYQHKLPQSGDLAAVIRSSESFALGDYASALAQGSNLPSARRAQIVRRLHELTGISEAYLARTDLRIGPEQFEKQLLGGNAEVIGRYDGRYTGTAWDRTAQVPEYDPSYSDVASAYISTFNDYVRKDLGYRTDAQYMPLRGGLDWDFRRKSGSFGDVLPDLGRTLTENPRLRVFSANGYFDMATPFFQTEYLLDHMGIDQALHNHITFGFYQSGHMVYVNPSALAVFHNDLERWYDSVLALP
ncbi:MAG: peptidase S10 [Candidatus Eremiobacteraeota bacterium]|nr:peptidase S10 [Candidatus Eremiobacteraeota bacterium]